jgi:NOL1/NOP2/fmu family ribosome biogenesis protein
MELKILNSREKKGIVKLIKEQFNCDFSLDYEVFMNPKNKIFILNRDVSKIDMDELRINSLGLYFGEINRGELRLSIEGSQIIGPLAKNNVLELKDSNANKWMSGEDFDVKTELMGFVIVKNKKDFLGCGRVVNMRLLNYVPKERRV